MLFKLSNLNTYLALTLDYLNPAFNNSAQKFKSVENKYCCSEHFVPNDYRISLTGHRKDLKTGAISSVFPWSSAKSHVREERLRLRTQAKISHKEIERSEESLLSDEVQDSVNFIGPPTIEQFAEEKCLEVEILKKELSKAREKEYVFTFGLERFSKNPDDIHFYTGFPDYEALIAVWN